MVVRRIANRKELSVPPVSNASSKYHKTGGSGGWAGWARERVITEEDEKRFATKANGPHYI